jgi:hypothetical protein
MKIVHKRLAISFVLNILIIIVFITALIAEIVDIHTNPDSVYKNVWGLFRYFTIDGNLFSFICSIILSIKQFKILKISETENVRELIYSPYNYILSLMSACTDLVIFIVVLLILMPLYGNKCLGLIDTYNASSFHIIIPILLNLKFIFLDAKERDLLLYEKILGGVPMIVYGFIMLILCLCKVFTGYGEEGDGNIPYPFFDIYHQNVFLPIMSTIFILGFGFGIGFLLDFLNKKCENIVYPYNYLKDVEVNQEMELS